MELKPCNKCGKASMKSRFMRAKPHTQYAVACDCKETPFVWHKTPDDATATWNALPRTGYKALAQQLTTALKLSRDCAYHGGQVAVLERVNAALAAAKAAGLEVG